MPSVVDFNYSPCALVLETNPLERVSFQSFPDRGIGEGYSATYAPTTGRAAEPFGRIWGGGDWAAIQLELEFRAGLSRSEIGPPGIAIGKMINKINWLKACPFPRPDTRPARQAKVVAGQPKSFGKTDQTSYGGQAADPPIILFVWGMFMTLRGVVTDWRLTWTGPYEPISGKPHGAEISLSFQPQSGFYPNWYDIRDGSMPNTILGRFI
jgi:hypothetical protein